MEKIKDINQGDILTFRAADNKYKALICTSTNKNKSPQSFTFMALTIESGEKLTMSSVLEGEFFGIGNALSNYFIYSEQELNKMWAVHPEIKPYSIGTYGHIIWRKDFLKFSENFELVGNLQIVDNLDKNGNGFINVSSWEFLNNYFNEKFKTLLDQNGQKKYKVQAIVKD